MLTIRDKDSREHQIAHFQEDDLPALREITRRFDGEIAVWSSNFKEWVKVSDLDLYDFQSRRRAV